jgi:molecular chaperone DnaK
MDLSSKNNKEILITQSGLLSKDEVERFKEEANKLSQLDLKKKEIIVKKNKLINQIFALKHVSSSKLPDEFKKQCAELIKKAEKEIEKGIIDAMDKIEKQLQEFWQKANALSGEPEPQKEIKGITMEAEPNQAFDSQNSKKDKEDTKPLKVTF